MKRRYGAALLSLVLGMPVMAENFRTIVAGSMELGVEASEQKPLSLSYVDSVVVKLAQGSRFLKGIELDLKIPQAYFKYRGSLALSIYTNLKAVPPKGIADIQAERVGFELLPNKLQAVYQIPLRPDTDLKASPYVSIPTAVLSPTSFPILIRLMPVIKGLGDEIESMVFQLSAKSLIANEGALKTQIIYPEQLKDKPFTVLIDDAVVEDPTKERILKEGEHNLTIVSDAYRNESRTLVIERGKVLDISINLQDPTPLISFEGPENAIIFFDKVRVEKPRQYQSTEPGEHEVLFQVGDYSIVKQLTIQRGRNYQVSLTVDVTVTEKN